MTVDDCAGVGDGPLIPSCEGYLSGSERARAQWTLERQLRTFEGFEAKNGLR